MTFYKLNHSELKKYVEILIKWFSTKNSPLFILYRLTYCTHGELFDSKQYFYAFIHLFVSWFLPLCALIQNFYGTILYEFWRKIQTIRPRYRMIFDTEILKKRNIFQRRNNRSGIRKNRFFKICDMRASIIKSYHKLIIFIIFGRFNM